jgi:hypothetical protein
MGSHPLSPLGLAHTRLGKLKTEGAFKYQDFYVVPS